MIKLYQDKKYYEELRKNAKKTLEDNFSISKISEKIEKRVLDINNKIKDNTID